MMSVMMTAVFFSLSRLSDTGSLLGNANLQSYEDKIQVLEKENIELKQQIKG